MTKKNDNQRLGGLMKAAAERAGVDAEAVAEGMGVTSETVYRYYGGQIAVPRSRLEKFAELAKVPIFALLPESEAENLLQWLEATVRHRHGLSRDDTGRLDEALTILSRYLGPVPEVEDDDAWSRYLGELRRFLVQAQKSAIADIEPTESQEP